MAENRLYLNPPRPFGLVFEGGELDFQERLTCSSDADLDLEEVNDRVYREPG